LQKMAREGMAEHMRADPRGANPRDGGAGLEVAGESLAREGPNVRLMSRTSAKGGGCVKNADALSADG